MCPVFFLIKFNIILYIWLFILKYKSVVVPFSFAFAFAKFFGVGWRVGDCRMFLTYICKLELDLTQSCRHFSFSAVLSKCLLLFTNKTNILYTSIGRDNTGMNGKCKNMFKLQSGYGHLLSIFFTSGQRTI